MDLPLHCLKKINQSYLFSGTSRLCECVTEGRAHVRDWRHGRNFWFEERPWGYVQFLAESEFPHQKKKRMLNSSHKYPKSGRLVLGEFNQVEFGWGKLLWVLENGILQGSAG